MKDFDVIFSDAAKNVLAIVTTNAESQLEVREKIHNLLNNSYNDDFFGFESALILKELIAVVEVVDVEEIECCNDEDKRDDEKIN